MPDIKNIDLYRHLSLASVGGFFGSYAILCRSETLASAQTMNLLELTERALSGDMPAALLHFGAFALYVAGAMLTVLLPRFLGADMRRVSPLIDALACVILCFIPADANIMLALYPIFFAMSVQWNSFSGAKGFVSATIFSTNNTRQASLALAHYIADGGRADLNKLKFYGLTLLAFHLGAAIGYYAVKLMGVQGAWVNLIQIGVAYTLIVCEDRCLRRASDEEKEIA